MFTHVDAYMCNLSHGTTEAGINSQCIIKMITVPQREAWPEPLALARLARVPAVAMPRLKADVSASHYASLSDRTGLWLQPWPCDSFKPCSALGICSTPLPANYRLWLRA